MVDQKNQFYTNWKFLSISDTNFLHTCDKNRKCHKTNKLKVLSSAFSSEWLYKANQVNPRKPEKTTIPLNHEVILSATLFPNIHVINLSVALILS